MSLVSSARILSAGLTWRRARLRSAGHTLVSALSSEDENVQTMAGMMLVQAGERSIPLLEEAIAAGRGTDLHQQVLDDIRPHQEVGESLDELSESDNPTIAEAARRARELLDDEAAAEGHFPQASG